MHLKGIRKNKFVKFKELLVSYTMPGGAPNRNASLFRGWLSSLVAKNHLNT